jgi:hypothetical protein
VKLQRNCNLSALQLEEIFETVGAMVNDKDEENEIMWVPYIDILILIVTMEMVV